MLSFYCPSGTSSAEIGAWQEVPPEFSRADGASGTLDVREAKGVGE